MSTAVETMRWTEEARHWIRLCDFPATAEQLTSQLLAMCAPNWLLWRLNAAAAGHEALDSVDAVLHLLLHADRRRGGARPGRF